MQPPVSALLDNGTRLHLQHGPIDLLIGAEGDSPDARGLAFRAARRRFDTLLGGLVEDLPTHRKQLRPSTPAPQDRTARRMYDATRILCHDFFLTPMIAVAGAVADEILRAMTDATPLTRAYVNNGGDIAVHLRGDATFTIAMAQTTGADLGRIRFDARDGIGGVATSGTSGRSHSLGIAESVTVIAPDAARADAAATLIANAVDLPDNPQIIRVPANSLSPDSDLGARLVVTSVPPLLRTGIETALAQGLLRARTLLHHGHISGAALFLQGQTATLGHGFDRTAITKDVLHA